MAAEQQTPTELGIPLPLVPIENLADAQARDQTNWHHHFHPRRSPLLTTEGGFVIRTARLQVAIADGSHVDYHNHYTGPPLPSTNDERFRVAVLARAGYIPEQGLLMRGDRQPRRVTLSPYQRLLLSEGQIRGGSTGETQRFLGEFILGQDLSDVNNLVEEFLHNKDQERRRYLGNILLSEAIHRATIPIATDYRKAWASEKIPHTWPAKPQGFLRSVLRVPVRRNVLVKQLQETLAEAA